MEHAPQKKIAASPAAIKATEKVDKLLSFILANSPIDEEWKEMLRSFLRKAEARYAGRKQQPRKSGLQLTAVYQRTMKTRFTALRHRSVIIRITSENMKTTNLREFMQMRVFPERIPKRESSSDRWLRIARTGKLIL